MAAPMELYCWKGDWGLPSVDPDCLTVLTYAKFSGAPLKVHKITNPWRSPSGRLPALKTSDDGVLFQPSRIITHLRKQKYNADYDLSARQGADTLAFISLLEEKLLPALIHSFWVEGKNYVEHTRKWYAESIPFPLNFFLPNQMHKRNMERLKLIRGESWREEDEEMEGRVSMLINNPCAAQNRGGASVIHIGSSSHLLLHTEGTPISYMSPHYPPVCAPQLYTDAHECLSLLSQRLANNNFFFGDSPASLDAYVFSHLAPILNAKLPNNKLQQHLSSLPNLCRYCTSIITVYFPWEQESGPRVAPKPPSAETQDTEDDPHKRRNQVLSVLAGLLAMVGYAVLSGIVSIQRVAPDHALEQGITMEDNEEEEE
ncbi:metaxin 1 S homeolog isoform X1 [Xenopus laevis]|uniref:Metaxin n=1 Tax=Xenopus laevis TaxID=8355 RepID=A0A8J0TEP8_XENLA|nr:metaxin 1 S homeolog isoform X1 [Xenopus laevis]